ncbi:MAG TPA: hypothetical protein VHC69_25005 [Polyangiaceae bacterium]|nr:hypothetical protein [Polyangiaceae bacterium]
MHVRFATTKEVIARSAGELLNRESFDGDAPVPGGLFAEAIFGPYLPADRPWGPAGHCVLAEPVLHPLAHALFAALVEAPADQITGVATGAELWRLPKEPWTGGPLELIGRMEFMAFERDPDVVALTTVNALRALLEQSMTRDPSAFHARAIRAGVADATALFLDAVPVVPSLARGPRGPCKELDSRYNAIVFNKQRFRDFQGEMPFMLYRLASADCAKSVFDLFNLKHGPPASPHQLPDTRRSIRDYLEESAGARLPLDLARNGVELDVPDSPRHRALLEGMALTIE